MKNPEITPKRKETIFKAALHCFNKNGYFKTSMDAIAARAKMSKLGLYYHFKSKDELFIQLFHYRGNKYFEHVQRYIQGAKSLEERIKIFASREGQISKENEDFIKFSLEFMSIGSRKPQIRKAMTDYYKNSIGHFRGMIEEGIDTGEFKKVDSERISRAVFFLSLGIFFAYFSLNVDFDLVDQHMFDINYIITGLKKK
jgi:AcrR family transcriptional regulator